MTEARALASAGELATGVLIGHPRSAATATAACIRALALIGTEHALDGIATYAKDSRLTVIKELVRAWSYFVTEEYARRVLSQSPLDDGTLRIRDPAVIEAAKTLNNAVSIHISVPGKLRTLDTVTDMANLEVLDVTGSPGIVDLSPLETTGRLRQLWLYGCRAITDLTPLASLEHLTVVSAAYTSVSELEPLRDLPKLERVILDGTPVEDISPLSGVLSLQTLELSGCEGLKSVARLSGHKSLRFLDIATCGLEGELGLVRSPGTSGNRCQPYKETRVAWKSRERVQVGIRPCCRCFWVARHYGIRGQNQSAPYQYSWYSSFGYWNVGRKPGSYGSGHRGVSCHRYKRRAALQSSGETQYQRYQR